MNTGYPRDTLYLMNSSNNQNNKFCDKDYL